MKIALLLVDGITLFHCSTPLLVFSVTAQEDAQAQWECFSFTMDDQPILTAENISLAPTGSFAAAQQADWLIIPAWPAQMPQPEPQLLKFIRVMHTQGVKIIGLCVGAFPVCASGLLAGRTATTHWAANQKMQQLCPDVKFDPAALYIDHGDVLTSAGTAAALDACIHLVRAQGGADLAAKVAAQLIVAPHREGYQTQHASFKMPAPIATAEISSLLDFIEDNLATDLSLSVLANQALLSSRQLTRKFKEVMGVTPAFWVKQRRLNRSRQLLEKTDLSLGEIAGRTGFNSPVSFRQAFRDSFGLSPSSYRANFHQDNQPAALSEF